MKVFIFGAGISGIACAHELLKRGAEVELHEKNSIVGGMARSEWDSKADLYTEHSWRGYAPFYRNLFALLSEVPSFSRMFSAPIQFALPKNKNREVEDASIVDKALLAPQILMAMTASPQRQKEFASKNVLDVYDPILSQDGKDAIVQMLGPGLGLNPYKTSVHHLAKFVAATLEPPFMGVAGELSKPREQWAVATGPTNDVVLDPWVRYLQKKYGNRFSLVLKSELKGVHPEFLVSGTAGFRGVLQIGDSALQTNGAAVVLAIDPFTLPKILDSRLLAFPEMHKVLGLVEEGPDSMPSFRISFSAPISLGEPNTVVALPDSEFNLTLCPQMRFWQSRFLEILASRGVHALWSGTACVGVERPGPLHGKPAILCSPQEFKEEVVWQLARSEGLNSRIKRYNGGRDLRWFLSNHLKQVELWHEWSQDPEIGVLKSSAPKWVTTTHTHPFRPSQKTGVPGLFLCGAHTKTSMDLWSMEGAAESGRLAAAAILGMTPSEMGVWEHEPPRAIEGLAMVDTSLENVGFPHVLEILVLVIVLIMVASMMLSRDESRESGFEEHFLAGK